MTRIDADDATKTFSLSVRELAEDRRFYPIGFDRGEGWSGLCDGSELHSRVLKARQARLPGYRAEVFLRARLPVAGWTAVITGRLDGCLEEAGGGFLIEEFKSALFVSEGFHPSAAAYERHLSQLMVYCHLWAGLVQAQAGGAVVDEEGGRAGLSASPPGHPPVRGALVYVDAVSGREMAFPLAYDPEACAREIQGRLRKHLAEWLAGEEGRRRKAALAPLLPFPHTEPRPGQQRLIGEIRAAIAEGGNLLAEAATGSGKTAASLHPALQAGLATGRQVVFLTAKNLQQEMAVRALKAMNQRAVFRTAQIRSKERMCANGQVLCHEDFCRFARDYAAKMESTRVLDRLLESNAHLDPDTVFAESRQAEVCPFEVQLEVAARADAIVADYNYVFEPAAALKHLAEEGLGRAILLVDEAHNLPDRARGIYSPSLREEELAAVHQYCLEQAGPRRAGARRLQAEGGLFERLPQGEAENPVCPRRLTTDDADEHKWGQDETHNRPSSRPDRASGPFERLAGTLEEWLALLRRLGSRLPETGGVVELDPPADEAQTLFEAWQAPFLAYLAWKRERKLVLAEDPIVGLHFGLQRFAAVLRMFGPGFTCVLERSGGSVRLGLLCLDPARAVAPVFRSARSTIFLSATLSPPALFQKALGLDPDRTRSLSIPPPFPKENRRILILPQVRTSYKTREKNYQSIADLITAMAGARPANYLALFPSYAFLTEVSGRMSPGGPRMVAQRPDLTLRERGQILESLGAPPPGGILLMAVLGGMYAEGVDYPGELLSGVFVVSPALPRLSFERELLRRYYDGEGETGFDHAYLQPGMTRVIQAAGRLIRNETDRGVIVLLCARFLEEPYRSRLPKDWYERSPLELISRDPAGDIRRFFGEG
jgi:DNA excision repair protein ERCC-2